MDTPAIASQYKYPLDIVEYFVATYGEQRTLRLLSSLKSPGKHYTIRANTLRADLATIIERLESRGIKVLQHREVEEALLIPVEGPFDVPREGKRVIADKYAAESVMIGSHLYAPGVLKAEEVKKGDQVYITDVFDQVVGFGVAEMDGSEMGAGRKGLAVRVEVTAYKVPSLRELPEHAEGLIYEQSLPSMVVSRVLDPQPGDYILDMCAAPGGKATHIAQLTRNQATVVALDHSKARITKLRENVVRLGAYSIRPIRSDSRYVYEDFPFFVKPNKILIDPPCSALGVRPKLYETSTLKDVEACAEYQKQFFRAAVKVLRSRGIIVYSTCTFTRHENEQLIEQVVEELGLELVEQGFVLGSSGEYEDPVLSAKVQRFYPDVHDVTGYFIAKLKKKD